MPKKGEDKSNGKRRRTEGSSYPTVSIAVAGSVIDNTMSLELATLLAGQIARAAAIFRIDEVIVYDDSQAAAKASAGARRWGDCAADTGAVFMGRVLQYLETPQYLRRILFPMHPSLRFVGLLPPLDAPHHLRQNEWLAYREGVVQEKTGAEEGQCYVNVGLGKDVVISQKINPRTRVTVKMGSNPGTIRKAGAVLNAVKPSEPRVAAALYWGFTDGYDYSVGTSEHGDCVASNHSIIPSFKHLLIVFGGVSGLEWSLKQDSSLEIVEVRDLFDCYLNTCPAQGSRTIRTEEAILISLQFLQNHIQAACK